MMNKKKELAKYGKLLHDKGLAIASGGNISTRNKEGLIIKKQGADMSSGQINDYVSVTFKNIERKRDVLSTETPFHLACYHARRNVGAVVHAHSPAMVAAAGKIAILDEDISYEFQYIVGSAVPTIESLSPGSDELAAAIASEIKQGSNAVLIKKHGAVSVGCDIEQAYMRMIALERACLTFLLS
jgi:L-fuculose-phosphate aldolase